MSRQISLSYLRRIVGVETPTIKGGGVWTLDGWDGCSPLPDAPGYTYQQVHAPTTTPGKDELLLAWTELGSLPASCGFDEHPRDGAFPAEWLKKSLRFLGVVGDPFEHRPQLGEDYDRALEPITLWIHSGRLAGAAAQGFEDAGRPEYSADFKAWRKKQPAKLADPRGAYMWHLSRRAAEDWPGLGRVQLIPTRKIQSGATGFTLGIPDVLTLSWLLLLEEKRGAELCKEPQCGGWFLPGNRGRRQEYCSVRCYDRHYKRLTYSKKKR